MTHQEAGPPSASPSHSSADEVDAGVGASILIVDDERPLLRVLSAGLEAKGYLVRKPSRSAGEKRHPCNAASALSSNP